MKPVISIIIPALNEARRLPGLIAALASEPESTEIIVVDGGSDDGSAQVARAAGARVLQSSPGRGRQIALGAGHAAGEVLLFLHADSRFPAGGLAAILRALGRAPDVSGGNFQLLFDGDDEFSRWLDGFYARIRRRGLYYGDSGIFVRRSVYDQLGGIRPIDLLEDYDFVRRLERAGRTVCVESPPLVTSSRRFHGRGKWAIIRGWIRIHLYHAIGISPAILARMYDSARQRQHGAKHVRTGPQSR